MDLRAVKAADRRELSACAMAAARNAMDLLRDAEMLAGAGSPARAYSLAALAVEECGKAGCLCVLAVVPKTMRRQAPVARMLQWHQLKQVAGLLVAVLSLELPGLAVKLADMPASRAAQIVGALSAPADQADRLKRNGLYVDMDRTGRIHEPREITDAEVTSQLALARQAAASISPLLEPEAEARIANPPTEVVEFACALVIALTQAGSVRTPEDAAGIMLNAVDGLQRSMATKQAAGPASPLGNSRADMS